MSRTLQYFAALAIVFTSLMVAAPRADAQGTKVVVIDQARIMRDSAAGKDIQQKIANIETTMGGELNPQATAIKNEGDQLNPQIDGKTLQDIQADPALAAKVNAFADKVQTFNAARQRKGGELQLTERKAWGDFFTALRPVLREVVEAQGADIVLDRQNVIYGGQAVDITDEVITRLNAATPTITVVRQTLPEQAAAQQ